MQFTPILALAAVLLISSEATARDPLLSHFEGKWGVPGAITSCEDNSATIRFSHDGSEMVLEYVQPIEGPDGSSSSTFRYDVIAVAGSSVRMTLDGESRTTDEGEPVVWDLVHLTEDLYCWHRADWELGRCTPPRIRCESLLDDFERMIRARTVEILELLERGRYHEAALLFQIPPYLGESDAERERRRLADSLTVIVRELGHPTDWSEAEQTTEEILELVNVSVGPMHTLVDRELGNYFLALFQVHFRHEGAGYVRAAFSPDGEALQIRFSLPASHAERMAEIGSMLLRETAPDQ